MSTDRTPHHPSGGSWCCPRCNLVTSAPARRRPWRPTARVAGGETCAEGDRTLVGEFLIGPPVWAPVVIAVIANFGAILRLTCALREEEL